MLTCVAAVNAATVNVPVAPAGNNVTDHPEDTVVVEGGAAAPTAIAMDVVVPPTLPAQPHVVALPADAIPAPIIAQTGIPVIAQQPPLAVVLPAPPVVALVPAPATPAGAVMPGPLPTPNGGAQQHPLIDVTVPVPVIPTAAAAVGVAGPAIAAPPIVANVPAAANVAGVGQLPVAPPAAPEAPVAAVPALEVHDSDDLPETVRL